MNEAAGFLPPRVLLVMPEQWPRALLRAALRELGYDAVGAPSVEAALMYPPQAPGRGPVRLILLDQSALASPESAELLEPLSRRHENPARVLLARAGSDQSGSDDAATRWDHVVHRPVSVADLAAAVQGVLPLPGTAAPLD